MEVTEGKLKRLRNLPAFKNKSEEELIEYLKNKPQKERKPRRKKIVEVPQPITVEDIYTARYNQKLVQLTDEFGIDMNDANDAENIRIFIRLSIQLEDINQKIQVETGRNILDTKSLKEMGEFQKSLVNGITGLQDKLGITRKVRKEKQVDDIPQYLKEIRRKAKDFWNRTTTSVTCDKCQIELSRYWLNFPDLAATVKMELECWKCGEKIVFVR